MSSPAQSISYSVPLIPQPNSTSCWAAAMAMVVSYWQRASVSPASIASAVGLHLDSCYGWDVLYDAANYWGFRAIPSACYIGPAWVGFLSRYGPLWLVETGAPSHAVVLTGGDGASFSVNNPWPPNIGARETKTLAQLSRDFEGAASAVGNNVQLLYKMC
jgi:ABC-type bacteriocin/lantibiotic exporter with double-glycine peptidase domain